MRYGPESILPYSYAGTIGVLGYGSMDRRFFHRLGGSQLDRTICSEAGGVAWNLVYGKKLGTPTEDFRLAKLILAWGANIHGNNVHLWPMVEQARRNGARLIVIDPYKTRTAALADWHIAIRPGTDAALALGMMHVILSEGLEDRAYIDEMTHGFAQLAERVRRVHAGARGGVDGNDRGRSGAAGARVRDHAAGRAAAELWRAAQRKRRHGGAGHCHAAGADRSVEASRRAAGSFDFRRVCMEQAGAGAAGPGARFAAGAAGARGEHVGAGTGADAGGRCQRSGIRDPTAEPEADVLSGGPAVHALFVYNSNPGAVAPNQNAVRRGLARTDLFTVVHDLFFNDTTDYADYVLPATTFLEHTDIQGAYGHYFVQLSNQAIEPPGEARSNVWLFSQLAQRMGFTEACFRDTPKRS